jgi:hypothetical protein
VVGEFPEIEAQPDDNRKLGMDTGEIPGNNGIESTDYRKFPRILLREITKGKKFNLHVFLLFGAARMVERIPQNPIKYYHEKQNFTGCEASVSGIIRRGTDGI